MSSTYFTVYLYMKNIEMNEIDLNQFNWVYTNFIIIKDWKVWPSQD